MRILLVSNMYPSSRDRTYGVFVQGFVESVPEIDFDLAVLRGRTSSGWMRAFKYLKFFLVTIWKYLFGRYDLVYLHFLLHPALVLLPLVNIRRRRLVLNAHGDDVFPRSRLHFLLHPLARRLVRHAERVVVPSEFFGEAAQRSLGVAKERVFVSPSSGVDRTVFRPGPVRSASSGLRIGFVSRLDVKKGLEVLLEGAALARAKGIPIEKIVIGGYGNPQECAAMESGIRRLGLESVCDYRGALQHQDMVDLYQNLDIFVFPTLYRESLGLVALEAMACGLPVIGSNLGAIPDYVHPGRNGFLFEGGDHAGLCSALEQFHAAPPEERARLRAGALEMAACYDKRKVADDLRVFLEGLTAGPPGAASPVEPSRPAVRSQAD